MPLLPKTPAEWTRSFVVPLFTACIVVTAALFYGGLVGGREWRYLGTPVANVLLRVLGLALGVSCVFGKGLSPRFRTTALIVAEFSAIFGPMWGPALAE
jgi:hypothetical protein